MSAIYLKVPFFGNRSFEKYIAENTERYAGLGEYENVAFGRYPEADTAFIALEKAGLLKGKNLYFASNRTKILKLAKTFGIKSDMINDARDLKRISEKQCLYAHSEKELGLILRGHDKTTLSEMYIVCDDENDDDSGIEYNHTYNKALFLGVRNAITPDELQAYKKFILFEGLSQGDQDGNMLIGTGMKEGFGRSYSLKVLKDIIYASHRLVSVYGSPVVTRIGHGGKKLVVEYDQGAGKETARFLKDRLLLGDDAAGQMEIVRIPLTQRKKSTRDGGNIMLVPYSPDILLREKGEQPSMTETDIENFEYIGRHRSGLSTLKKANVELYSDMRKPKTRFM